MSIFKLHSNTRLFFLLLLLAGVTNLYASNKNDITIPFQLSNGLIILEAEIDGVKGEFLLDTGADAVMIDGHINDSDQIIATPNGDVATTTCQVSQIKIGDFVQHEIKAQVISLANLKEHLGIDLHGIIGGSYFMPNALVIDFSNSTITISPEHTEESTIIELTPVPFKMVNHIPVVEIEIEGNQYNFAMDSGASIHFIEEDIISKIKTLSILEESSKVATLDHSNQSTQRFILNRFSLNSINFIGHHCLSLNFDDVNSTFEEAISGILSLSQLSRDKVVFDFHNKLLYL